MTTEDTPLLPDKPSRDKRRRRRNYVAELADLQSRVNTAVMILGRVAASAVPSVELVAVAVDILRGE